MWLVFQIAAGIVLGWYVITHWEQLKRLSKSALTWIVGAAIYAGATALFIWSTSFAWHKVGGQTSHTWLNVEGTIILIVLMVVCMIGTAKLLYKLFPWIKGKGWRVPLEELTSKQREDRQGASFYVGFFGGMIQVILLTSIYGEQTMPLLSAWSRDNGFKDLGEMMTGALLGQWVWVPLAVIFWLQKRAGKAPIDRHAP